MHITVLSGAWRRQRNVGQDGLGQGTNRHLFAADIGLLIWHTIEFGACASVLSEGLDLRPFWFHWLPPMRWDHHRTRNAGPVLLMLEYLIDPSDARGL